MVAPLKDPLMTVAFMKGVLAGKFFLLKQEQVEHTRQCADWPPKKELAEIVADVLLNCPNIPAEVEAAVKSTAHLIRKKKPDSEWQLQLLAQFAPEHELFSKNYVHPRRARNDAQQDFQVPNPNNFFDGLPDVSIGKRSQRPISFVDPSVKKRARLDRMERQLNDLNRRVREERQRVFERRPRRSG